MSHLESIQATLGRALQRRRCYHGLLGAGVGLLAGAILALLVLGAYLLFPLPSWLRFVAAGIPVPCLLAGALAGAWRKPGLNETARWVDNHQHLQERLSTAMELANEPAAAAGPWRDLVLADAAARTRDIDPSRLLPFHLPRTVQFAAVILAVVAGLGFIPEYRSPAHLRKAADRENIRQVGQQLAELTRHSLEKRPPVIERNEETLQALAQMGDQLTKKNLERSEALRDLANVADKLKEQLKEMGKDPALKSLEQAARSSGANETQTAASLQKQLEALKETGAPQADPQKLDQLKRKLEQLQQAAAAKQGQSLDAQEQKKLSDSLAALAKEAQDLGVQLPSLDEAMAALAAQQPGVFLKDLQVATADLEKLRDLAKSLQQLQQAMQKLGKDLPEQLKNGQAAAAKERLEKMAKDLAAAGLKSEDLQKLLDEVTRAADPAGEYGKLADLLKQAAGEMKKGDKSAASQSLAAAARELENLMEQMGDAQQLMAALEQLNNASMCIGTGQGWCAGLGKPGSPGFKPGGQPGSGVGDWSDSSGTWDGQSTSGWDNSSVQRPDLAARSELGEGKSPEGLAPDKVRGQISPGAQMPSVSLKGVSIKGLSTVGYTEAAAAAQTEADSALSQEKVPRAYQGPVRDYFNDLK